MNNIEVETKKPELKICVDECCMCDLCASIEEKLQSPRNSMEKPIKTELPFEKPKLRRENQINTYLLAVVLDDYVKDHPGTKHSDINPSLIVDVMAEYMSRADYYENFDKMCDEFEEAIINDDIEMI